ncbi:hypothetical protein FQN52_007398 [Onygenales sp. PD_12]|nr:hypothetical protein FQN52_007398 [Onygenales sp. PD_12]
MAASIQWCSPPLSLLAVPLDRLGPGGEMWWKTIRPLAKPGHVTLGMRLDVEPGEDDDERPPWYQEHPRTPTWPAVDSSQSPPDCPIGNWSSSIPTLRFFAISKQDQRAPFAAAASTAGGTYPLHIPPQPTV